MISMVLLFACHQLQDIWSSGGVFGYGLMPRTFLCPREWKEIGETQLLTHLQLQPLTPSSSVKKKKKNEVHAPSALLTLTWTVLKILCMSHQSPLKRSIWDPVKCPCNTSTEDHMMINATAATVINFCT